MHTAQRKRRHLDSFEVYGFCAFVHVFIYHHFFVKTALLQKSNSIFQTHTCIFLLNSPQTSNMLTPNLAINTPRPHIIQHNKNHLTNRERNLPAPTRTLRCTLATHVRRLDRQRHHARRPRHLGHPNKHLRRRFQNLGMQYRSLESTVGSGTTKRY